MDLHMIITILSALASVTVVATFLSTRRRSAMDEGKRLEQMEQMRRDIEKAWARVHDQEQKLAKHDTDVGQIVTNLGHVLKAIERLETKIDKHLETHVLEVGA